MRELSYNSSFDLVDQPHDTASTIDMNKQVIAEWMRSKTLGVPVAVLVRNLLSAHLSTHNFFKYDFQSVHPTREPIQESYILSQVSVILDPKNIPDEQILSEMIDCDPFVRIPPKTRRNVTLRIERSRKGEPTSIDESDMRWA